MCPGNAEAAAAANNSDLPVAKRQSAAELAPQNAVQRRGLEQDKSDVQKGGGGGSSSGGICTIDMARDEPT